MEMDVIVCLLFVSEKATKCVQVSACVRAKGMNPIETDVIREMCFQQRI